MTNRMIHGLAFRLGEPNAIELLASQLGVQQITEFKNDGVHFYRTASAGAGQLASQSLLETLETSGVSHEAIDLLIVCNTTDRAEEIIEAIHSSGLLLGTPSFTMGGMGCAGMAVAARYAAALVASGQMRHIAIVSSDVAKEGKRLGQLDSAILSDGSASFLVSQEAAEGWSVLGSSYVADYRLRDLHRTRTALPRLLAITARGVKETASLALQNAKCDPGKIDYVVMTNFKQSMAQFFARLCGTSSAPLMNTTAAEVGHAFSCDPFLNLMALGSIPEGVIEQTVLLLAMGPYGWSSLVLRRSA